MLRATFKSLLARKLRLVLTAFAVVLGVAFVGGTLVLTDTLNRTFDDLFSRVNKNTSVAVRAKTAFDTSVTDAQSSRGPIPASLLAVVRGVDGVRAADGNVDGYAQVVDPKTKKAIENGGGPGLGGDYSNAPTSTTEIVSGGRAPTAPTEIVVDKATFDDHHLRIGEKVTVLTKQAPATYTIVGAVRVGGSDSLGGATLTEFEPATAQRVLLAPGQYSTILLAADPGVSQDQLRDRVAKVLPPSAEAITGKALAAETSGDIKDAIGGFSTFLLVFAAISLFVGAFIIFNTFTMIIAQRVRELALMRALGASKRQVRRSILVEALVIGVVGSTVGLGLGVLLALGLKALFSVIGGSLPAGGLVFAPRTVIACYLIGVLVTAVASLLPARKAASVPPVAAMRDTFALPARSLRYRGIAGGALAILGIVLLFAGLSGSGSSALYAVGFGVGLCFLGVSTLSPLISTPVTRFIGSPLPRLFGTTGRIGRENAMRNPRRTSATASALMIGMALVSAFAVLGASIKESTKDTVRNSLGADFILTAGNFGGQGFSPSVATSLQGKPGVDLATGLRLGDARVDSKKAQLLAGDPTQLPGVLALQPQQGSVTALKDGTILLDNQTAKDRNLAVGQKVRVTFAETGNTDLTIAGTYKRNALAGNYVISLGEYDKHFTSPLDFVVLVKRDPGADPAAVRNQIETVTNAYPNVDVRDQSEFIKNQEDQVNQFLTFVYVLLALAIVIAFFGIINTLALSVIERTHEIGLLRAVGMNRRQLRATIRLESVVISVFGAVLGVAVGSFFGWALVSALKDQGIQSFAYPLGTVIAVMIVAAVLGVLAAIFPARRAAKMDVLRAIATT